MIKNESYVAQIIECLNTEFYDIEIRQKYFLGEPFIYIRAWHKKKAVIFDISVSSFKQYGISIQAVKKEWCRAWGEW